MGMLRNLKLLRAVDRAGSEISQAKGDMKKIIPSLVTLAATAVTLFTPELQALLVAHPAAATVFAGIYALIKGLLPSPIAQ